MKREIRQKELKIAKWFITFHWLIQVRKRQLTKRTGINSRTRVIRFLGSITSRLCLCL